MLKKILNWLKDNYGLLALLAIALIIRVIGNGFGLPDELNVDEVHFVPHAIRFGAGDLNPHWFFYPPLYMYALFVLYAAYFVIGSLAGVFHGAADFGMQYFLDPTAFYLIGRTLTAVLGAATVWLTYKIGTRAYSRTAGLAAAILLAFCALHVEHSHYITSDIPMTFMATLCLLFSCKYIETGRARDIILAGLSAGLGMAVKYTAILAVPAAVFAIAARAMPKSAEDATRSSAPKPAPSAIAAALALLGAATAAGFIVGCPWIILDHSPVVADIMSTSRNISGAWLGQEEVRNMWLYVFTGFLRPGMGPAMLALCLAGTAWAALRRKPADIVIAGYSVVFYLWVAHYPHYGYARYWTAVLPALCLLGGRLLEDISLAVPRLKKHSVEIAGIAALLIAAPSGLQAIRASETLSLPYTQTLSRRWFAENVEPHTRIAVESHGPMLKADKRSLEDSLDTQRYAAFHVGETMKFDRLNTTARPWAEKSLTNKKYQLMALDRERDQYYIFSVFSLAEYPLEFYAREKFEYLVANRGQIDRYYAAPARFPKAAAFYRRLERECPPPPGGPLCELSARFDPAPGVITGDAVLIYRFKR